jgi:hypothetical protein
MSDQKDDQPGLALDTWHLLAAALAGQSQTRRSIGFQDLFEYSTGQLDEERIYEVELDLSRSAEHRAQALRIHSCLQRVRRLPLASLVSTDASDPIELQVVSAWKDLLQQLIATAIPVKDWWALEDWTSALEKIRARTASALSAAGALLWLGRRASPGYGVALARSASGVPGLVTGVPEPARITISASVDAHGSLKAVVLLHAHWEEFRGRQLVISYGAEELALPIFRTEISGREIELNLPSFGQLTGQPEGVLDSRFFSLSVGSGPQIENVWRISADVLGKGDEDRFQLELTEGPRIEEHLIINVSVPMEAIEKYPDGGLQISLLLGPDLSQQLGEWPLSDWVQGSRRLVIPCPGIKESFRAFGCVLMTQIRP